MLAHETKDAFIIEDAEILSRVRGGETAAYAELVRRHTAVAHRTALYLGAGPEADDVVQEAFVKAYRALGGFRDGAAFRPWLLRIVANETRNLTRSRRRRNRREETAVVPPGLLAAAEEAMDPASRAVSREARSELLAAIRELSEAHQLVVTCRYLLDLDEQDTATVLGWPRGTVKSRLHRALARLRSQLDTGLLEGGRR